MTMTLIIGINPCVHEMKLWIRSHSRYIYKSYDFHTSIFDLDEFEPYDISVSYDSIKSYEYDSHNFNIANHCGS